MADEPTRFKLPLRAAGYEDDAWISDTDGTAVESLSDLQDLVHLANRGAELEGALRALVEGLDYYVEDMALCVVDEQLLAARAVLGEPRDG